MWLQLSIAIAVVVAVAALRRRGLLRSRRRHIDLGSVSDAWLAQQRARGTE
jgi:hypothetical protein